MEGHPNSFGATRVRLSPSQHLAQSSCSSQHAPPLGAHIDDYYPQCPLFDVSSVASSSHKVAPYGVASQILPALSSKESMKLASSGDMPMVTPM